MQERRRTRRSATLEAIFGNVLRDIRKQQSMSQETLAFESGYHPTYIGQLERGEKNPSLRAILKLAKTLNTSGADMVGRVEVLLSPKP
jgi:transcriptional regulator with XRE-family HTH domain